MPPRLYPPPFRERFGEGMAQAFHDLCRERREGGRAGTVRVRAVDSLRDVGGNRPGAHFLYVTTGKNDAACGAGRAGCVDGAARGIAICGGPALGRGCSSLWGWRLRWPRGGWACGRIRRAPAWRWWPGSPWRGRPWFRLRTRDIRSACGVTVCGMAGWATPGAVPPSRPPSRHRGPRDRDRSAAGTSSTIF